MFLAILFQVTINGQFHTNSGCTPSGVDLWCSEKLRSLINYDKRISNFILFKKKRQSVMIYTKGKFRITFFRDKANDVVLPDHLIGNFLQILDEIRVNYASKLFKETLVSSSYYISQVLFGIRPPFDTPEIVYSKLVKFYPNSFVIQDITFELRVDHMQVEDGASHAAFDIYYEQKNRGMCDVYNNYKCVLKINTASLLQKIFDAVSDLLLEIRTRCLQASI